MVRDSLNAEVKHSDTDDPSLDVVFDLLANQRRRYALACLETYSGAVALADLAEDVAGRENEESRTVIPKEEIQTVRTSLSHIHIPKLVDAGVVEHDQHRNQVKTLETPDLVDQVQSFATAGGEER